MLHHGMPTTVSVSMLSRSVLASAAVSTGVLGLPIVAAKNSRKRRAARSPARAIPVNSAINSPFLIDGAYGHAVTLGAAGLRRELIELAKLLGFDGLVQRRPSSRGAWQG
jgi:hypothetical protein